MDCCCMPGCCASASRSSISVQQWAAVSSPPLSKRLPSWEKARAVTVCRQAVSGSGQTDKLSGQLVNM